MKITTPVINPKKALFLLIALTSIQHLGFAFKSLAPYPFFKPKRLLNLFKATPSNNLNNSQLNQLKLNKIYIQHDDKNVNLALRLHLTAKNSPNNWIYTLCRFLPPNQKYDVLSIQQQLQEIDTNFLASINMADLGVLDVATAYDNIKHNPDLNTNFKVALEQHYQTESFTNFVKLHQLYL